MAAGWRDRGAEGAAQWVLRRLCRGVDLLGQVLSSGGKDLIRVSAGPLWPTADKGRRQEPFRRLGSSPMRAVGLGG